MFLFLIILVATVYFLGVAIYLRVSGMKHKAVCLDYLSGWKAVITHVLYEYELIIAGKTQSSHSLLIFLYCFLLILNLNIFRLRFS